jgi:delta 1-pyrroline-5-carboxylate dehydrogenase
MLLLVTLNTVDSNGVNHSFISSLSDNDINLERLVSDIVQSNRDQFLNFPVSDGFVIVKSSEISWVKVIPDKRETNSEVGD